MYMAAGEEGSFLTAEAGAIPVLVKLLSANDHQIQAPLSNGMIDEALATLSLLVSHQR